MSDNKKPDKKPDIKSDTKSDEAQMLSNLDLLLNLDVVENENDWSLFSAGSSTSKDAMPNDLDEATDGGDK